MRLDHRIKMSNSLDRTFGERVLIVPMARTTYLSPTTDGAGYEAYGIVMFASRVSQPRGDEALKGAPYLAPMRRLDETKAARKPVLKWAEPEEAPPVAAE